MNSSRPLPTQIYDARALVLAADSLNVLSAELGKLPGGPLLHPLSEPNSVRYQICLYVIGSIRSIKEIGKAAEQEWFSGRFLAASVLIRMLIELWGSIAYVEDKVLKD